MKKIAFVGFLTSMLVVSGTAFATGEDVNVSANDSATLTTKNYVDDGLRYVYGVKANKADVYTKNDVYTKDEADAKFLTSVDTYSGENGVTVDNENKVKLNVTAQEGSMYVYTSEGWSELPVQDEWSADIFNTTPAQQPEP